MPRISRLSRRAALAVAGLLIGTCAVAPGAAAQVATPPVPKLAQHPVRRACAQPGPGRAACEALVRTDVPGRIGRTKAGTAPSGYGPASLQSAYKLLSATAGSGRTVAIVDAYDDPHAEADLGTYRAQYGLPACTTANGCFRKVAQDGSTRYPRPDPGWSEEMSLDLDMVSAACPACHILLVEADDNTIKNLGAAVDEAVALGAKYVSNSYAASEDPAETGWDSYYDHPGVAITAASGDNGYGTSYPAASPDVTAVGGTSLVTDPAAPRGWAESAWSGAGSGCSTVERKPAWQVDTGCANRTVADVSAVADPNTGVAVYDTSNGNGGWNEVGGTSASSPMLAAMFALAGSPGNTPADDIYTHASDFFDVTSGNDGSCSPAYLCTAETGYDGPTGIGTPDGTGGLTSGGGTTGNTVTVTNPGSQTSTTGSAASLQIHASDSASGQTLTYSATGLPAGLSINSSSGLISGTPTTAGTSSVTVTAKDTTGASGSAAFTWTVSSSSTGCSSTSNIVKNPNFASGSTSWTASSGVIGQWAPNEPPLSPSTYDAWLDGYGEPWTDTLSQTVTEPSGCTGTLEVWLHIDSDQTSGTNGSFTVQVAGTTVGTFTNLNANSGYTEHSFTIPSADAGKSLKLLFTGVENNNNNTDYVVGQVELIP